MATDDNARDRTTPRSLADGDRPGNVKPDLANAGTPFTSLRHLAGLIRKPATPIRRASSLGASSGQRTNQRPPSGAGRTPGTQGRTPSRRGQPATPHALRALQQRRAAGITPGRDRRRSGRAQRETPRETLRALSRVLALGTRPSEPSPQTSDQPPPEQSSPDGSDDGWAEEEDEEPALPAPRMSLPLDYNDDSLELDPPPVFSEGVDDEGDVTLKSVELPRRAVSELPSARPFRRSFGGTRYSDRFADLHELGLDFPDDASDQGDVRPDFDDDVGIYGDGLGEGTSELNDPTVTRDLRQDFLAAHSQRQSDIRPLELLPDGEDTFQLDFPQNDEEARVSSSPEPELAEPDLPDDEVEADAPARRKPTRARVAKELKVSRHGIPYPSLPASVVRKMAARYARSSGNGKSKINKDTLQAIIHASDLFFEQLSDDLGAYAKHARRKTIDESDMITLMRRQRQIDATKTPFALAQRHLPRELLQEIRMAAPPKARRTASRRLETVAEEDEEND